MKRKNYENNLLFNNDALIINDNSYITGYFQSENYFFDIRDILLQEITLINHSLVFIASKNMILHQKNTVAVHIRRGDYINGDCCLTDDYYKNAFEYIENKIINPIYCIFSDDLEYCQQLFSLYKNIIYINKDKLLNDCEELIIMSLCNHHIIANSSYSWWGAWLSQNQEQIVIAPDKWTKFEQNNSRDIIPDRWIRL